MFRSNFREFSLSIETLYLLFRFICFSSSLSLINKFFMSANQNKLCGSHQEWRKTEFWALVLHCLDGLTCTKYFLGQTELVRPICVFHVSHHDVICSAPIKFCTSQFSIPFGINKTNACKFVGKTYCIMRKVAVALIPRWSPLLLSVTMVTYSIKRKIIFASLTVYTIELCLLWVLNGSSNFLPLLWLAS